jgi:hypothetical protein
MLLLLRLSFLLKRDLTPLLEILLSHYFPSFLSKSREDIGIFGLEKESEDSVYENTLWIQPYRIGSLG